MDMKKILTISALILVLALSFLVWGFQGETGVAEASDTAVFAYVAPSDLENNAYASGSTVAVVDGETGDVLFYLIESYYYPVKSLVVSSDLTVYILDVAGLNATVDVSNLQELPKAYDGVTLENALPQNLLLKDGVTVTLGAHTIDTKTGWTVKLLGLNGDKFFVQASFNENVVFGLVARENFTTENVSYHIIDETARQGLLNKTPDENLSESGDTSKSTLLRIILIIGIAVPAVIIAIMLFKPGRNSAKTNYDRHAMRTRRDDDIDYDRDRRYDRDRDYTRRAPRDYDRDYDRRDDRDYGRRDDRDYDRRDYDRRERDYDRRDDRDYRDRRDDRDYDRRDDRRY